MKTLTFFLLLISALTVNAQMRVIPGVVSLFDNMRIKNVMVEAKKSGANALTDSLGNFSIVCEQNDVITFKANVFKPKRFKVSPSTDSINVDLVFKDSPEIIDEAVQNGFLSPSNASSAKANLSKDDVDFCKYNDIYELIEGRVAGVQVMNNNDIMMRGNTSLNGNNPALLVVDGRVVSNLSYLSPCDVKKISFMKNGVGTIYGSQGAGGVVLVETKKANEL